MSSFCGHLTFVYSVPFALGVKSNRYNFFPAMLPVFVKKKDTAVLDTVCVPIQIHGILTILKQLPQELEVNVHMIMLEYKVK